MLKENAAKGRADRTECSTDSAIKRNHLPGGKVGNNFKQMTNTCPFTGEWQTGELPVPHVFSVSTVLSPSG